MRRRDEIPLFFMNHLPFHVLIFWLFLIPLGKEWREQSWMSPIARGTELCGWDKVENCEFREKNVNILPISVRKRCICSSAKLFEGSIYARRHIFPITTLIRDEWGELHMYIIKVVILGESKTSVGWKSRSVYPRMGECPLEDVREQIRGASSAISPCCWWIVFFVEAETLLMRSLSLLLFLLTSYFLVPFSWRKDNANN